MRSAVVLATVLAGFAMFGVAIVGCLDKPQFECAASAECVQGSLSGTCQPDGLCSFPDSSCPSGERYGDLSGPKANQCVGEVPIDAMPPDALTCLGSGEYQLCFAMLTGDVTLAGTLDTSTDPRCMPPTWTSTVQPDACMIAGQTVTIGSVVVRGAKPLVIAAEMINVTGTLDVASHRGGTTGPGAPFAGCPAFAGAPDNDGQGGGGGAGATFKSRGGDGGTGDTAATDGGRAPTTPVANPTTLRAGCAGQAGGLAQGTPGPPGQAGGAVFLAASTITITATGIINASGAGGSGDNSFVGGSGGGSGGMIVLHGQTITGVAGARMLANGGGGAAGATNQTGANGSDPSTASVTSPAQGGGFGGAGQGGDGFAGTDQAETGTAGGGRGGGGGGGGAGYIQTNVALTNIAASPAVVLIP